MSLLHVADANNVMSGGNTWGPKLTTGQIYRMHFDSWGTVNSLLKANLPVARNCFSSVSDCPSATLMLW
jgi:hypothetical protein